MLDVEAGEAKRSAGEVKKACEPSELAKTGQRPCVSQYPRREAKGGEVDEGVVFDSEGALGLGKPRYASVEKIEDPGEKYRPGRSCELSGKGFDHREKTAEEAG